MRDAPTVATPATAAPAYPRRWRLRWPRRWLLAAIALLLVTAAAVAVAVIDPFAGGYAGDYSVVNQRSGTITWLPAVGRVVKQGQALFKVDGSPVVLLYGSMPVYRDLRQGESGADVRQLNAALAELGYDGAAALDPTSDEFGWRTRPAVEKLQDDLGVNETGFLARGTVVFLPTAIRVTAVSASLGAAAGPGAILKASSTRHEVAVQLDAAEQTEVKVGDPVTITLPSGRATPGRVSSVGSVASSASEDSGTPTIEVKVRLLHQAAGGRLDQAPVGVLICTGSVKHALVVPVNALLALAGGGYAVEVVNAAGVRRLVPVSLGLFDDEEGLVQVSGSGLRAGQRVVVPAS